MLAYIKDCIAITNSTIHDSLELLFIELRLGRKPLHFGIFYRPPSMSHCLPTLQAALESVPPPSMKNSILLGDFNIDLLTSTSTSTLLSELDAITSCFHYSQVVTEPTRVTDSTATQIDHVYVTDPVSVAACSTAPPLQNSDHLCIVIGLKYRASHLRAIPRRIWRYATADFEGANEALLTALSDSTSDNVNSTWDTFKTVFLSMMSFYIPNKVVAARRSFPWLNRDLRTLFHKRDAAFRRAKKTCRSSHWEAYKKLRNRAVGALRAAKRTYFKDLSSYLSSPRKFWNAYHALSSNRQRVPHLLSHGPTTAESTPAKANLLNSFFSSCFSTPKGTINRPSASVGGLPSISCTSEDVAKVIQTLKPKSASGPDGISTLMLKGCSSSISPSLFNQSLSDGVVPTDWKLSNVTPVYKADDPKLANNYRPISLLSIPSKILERIVHNKLLQYLLENNLLSPSQFGFIPQSSTQEALVTAVNDWHQYLDSGLETASIFFDLSKAFDVLPHSAILQALANVGVHGPLYS